MGNKQSQAAKEFLIQINHPRFSQSKILTQEGEKRLQTSQAVEEKEYDKWKKGLAQLKTIPENLLLPRDHAFSKIGLCGNTGTLTLTYDNYPYLLAEEIYNRRGLKGKFTEQELWGLLFGLTQARRQAGSIGERLGDIRPKNIFLNEKGSIKVTNSLSWPLELTNIQKSYDKTPTYLSPEDLASIEKGEVIDAPSDQSEAFSIGLSVLTAGNLAQFDSLYDLMAHRIDQGRLNQALTAWAVNSTYSQVLRGTVLLLLNMNPQRRLSCSELSQLLIPHGEPILKRENFVVDNAPPKLHEEIQHLRKTLLTVIPVPLAPPAPILVMEGLQEQPAIVQKQ